MYFLLFCQKISPIFTIDNLLVLLFWCFLPLFGSSVHCSNYRHYRIFRTL